MPYLLRTAARAAPVCLTGIKMANENTYIYSALVKTVVRCGTTTNAAADQNFFSCGSLAVSSAIAVQL